ncbi:hypothetical protein NECAME_14276 [Necator americanus]|uniref:Uncharacterized protein n=1 Tax=Necator americanus TaxID=51031 RepID=W2SRI6_NECAM|nr:hypothetical protein NECAME_14276 [Necator americanus]ETN71287.1 hypothetical protein NECAME_14276 [Necator americanus]
MGKCSRCRIWSWCWCTRQRSCSCRFKSWRRFRSIWLSRKTTNW